MDTFFGALLARAARPGRPARRGGVRAGRGPGRRDDDLHRARPVVGARAGGRRHGGVRSPRGTAATPSPSAARLLASLLVLPLMLLDAEGIALLGVFAAAGVFLIGVTDARTPAGFLLSGISWPLSSLRGLPWFGRALRVVGTGGRTPAIVRTVVVSLIALGGLRRAVRLRRRAVRDLDRRARADAELQRPRHPDLRRLPGLRRDPGARPTSPSTRRGSSRPGGRSTRSATASSG